MKLLAYLVDGSPAATPVDIRPAPLERDWMDATDQRYAYRCLPLNVANTHGWEILCPRHFKAIWAGEPDRASIAVATPDGSPPPAMSHFGSGILTFRLPVIFRTEPGYDLWAQGPVNRPKDGIAPLTGLVETDWAPFTFTMNWKFTQPEVEVEFEPGEPFCHIFPVRRGDVEAVEPEFRPLAADPELEAQFRAWNESRREFNTALDRPGSEAQAQRWQKHYYRGLDMTGEAPVEDHRTRLKVRDFAPPPARD